MSEPDHRQRDEGPFDFILVRHGESEANAGLPTPSPAAIRLTETGRRQAAHLAGLLGPAPALVVVSPYLRTRETAEPYLARHPSLPVEEWPVQEFTYLDIERHAGTTEAQRAATVEQYWNRCAPFDRDGAGAESFADFIGRVDATLARFRERCDGSVIVFTHGYFIHAMERRIALPDEAVDPAMMRSFRHSWPDHAPRHCERRGYRFERGAIPAKIPLGTSEIGGLAQT
jgi:probable phosphoglycerate mutase